MEKSSQVSYIVTDQGKFSEASQKRWKSAYALNAIS